MDFSLAIHEEDGHYGVTVPDLPGCFAAGDTFDEALSDARSAIDAHVELLLEEGLDFPMVRSMDEHRRNPDLKGAIWGFVSVPIEKYMGRAEKINITVPAITLRKIDAFASSLGETRSSFLVSAAQKAMSRDLRPPAVAADSGKQLSPAEMKRIRMQRRMTKPVEVDVVPEQVRRIVARRARRPTRPDRD